MGVGSDTIFGMRVGIGAKATEFLRNFPVLI